MSNLEKIQLIAVFIEFVIGCIIAPIVIAYQLNKNKKGSKKMIITIEEIAMIVTALAIAIMIQSALEFLVKKTTRKGIAS